MLSHQCTFSILYKVYLSIADAFLSLLTVVVVMMHVKRFFFFFLYYENFTLFDDNKALKLIVNKLFTLAEVSHMAELTWPPFIYHWHLSFKFRFLYSTTETLQVFCFKWILTRRKEHFCVILLWMKILVWLMYMKTDIDVYCKGAFIFFYCCIRCCKDAALLKPDFYGHCNSHVL